LGLGEAPPESQAQTAGDGGGGKQSAGSVLSLPKGGGAVQGIGETFSPNPFTGTANFTVPIATSPGRSGFGPELSLQYSSGNGNGPFGLGWALSVPQISLKTERGIPQYQGKDTYLLSGAEDLVLHDQYPPVETEQKDYLITTYRPRVEGLFARIQHWKKIGGPADDQHFSPEFWRITTKDNITNLYGRTPQALLRHPDDPSRIYQWFLQLTHDMKGNYVHYEYLADNATDLPNKPYEEHRRKDQQQRGKNPRTWQVYLKCIRYGNIVPLASLDQQTVDAQLADLEQKAQDPTQHFKEHFFEVVFDYGDHGKRDPIPVPDEEKKDCLQGEAEGPAHQEITADIYAAKPSIPYRCDPFSSYRAGFEIRTYRRCHRVLMFHNGIPGESGPVLVKSTDFQYQADPYTNVSCLKSVTQRGYRKVKNSSAGTWYDSEELSLPNSQMPGARSQHYHIASFPPVEFGYTSFTPNNQKFRPFEAVGGDLPPRSLADPTFALVDVYGTGLPDVLHTMPNAYYVWRNLGNGQFDMRRPLKDQPAGVTLDQEGVGFGDMAGDGRADLLVHQGSHWHFYEATHRGGWKKAHFYERQPSFSLSDPNVKMVDLTGDGKSDVLRAEDSHFAWFPCLGEEGFGERKIFRRQHSLEDFPDVFFNDPRVRLIDLNGDGLTDIALIHDGRIDYWPNLGHGRWGARVTMENTPQFGPNFDPRRLLFADIDGSGPSDMVYVESDQVKFWLNQSGNAWSQEQVIHGTPQVTDLDSLEIADMFGTGTSGILYSTDYRGLGRSNYWYLDLTGGVKPYVLTEMTNNLGSTTRAEYSTSTQEYLQDLQENRPWITTLPFPVKVLKKVEVIDHIGKSKLVTTYRYHHGYYDGREREFRGFERVDQTDSEIFKDFAGSTLHEKQEALANVNEAFHVPPIHTKTWFHTGLFYEEDITTPLGNTFNTEYLLEYYREEYYEKDPLAFRFSSNEALEPGGGATVPALHLAYRALRGSVLRTEVYAQDGSDKEKHPYTVTESRFQVRKLQDPKPLADGRLQDGVFFPYKKETLTYHYERNPLDPRIAHDVTLQVDAYGQVTHAASWVYPRRPELQATGQLAQGSFKRDSALKEYQEQSQFLGTLTHKRVINPPALSPNLHTPTSDAEWAELSKRVLHDPWFVGVPYETQKCEIHHLHWDWACYIQGFFGDSGYGCGYEGRQPFSAAGLEALVLNSDGTPKAVLPFIGFKGTIPEARLPVLRLIDWSQTYFRTNREPEALTAPQNTDHRLPLGHIDSLALPFESYQAVFPKTFLTDQEVGFPFTDSNDSQLLALLAKGGYVTLMPIGEGTREDDYWWIPSGRQAFCPNKFYQPIQSQDPFGNNTTLYYDGDPLPSEDPPAHEQEASPLCPSPSGPNYWLLVQATKDPLGNIVRAVNDYVVLQPKAIIDPNDNHSEVAFDALGLVVGTAVKGKVKPQSPGEPENTEGDSLEGFTPYLTKEQLEALANPDDPTALARRLLRKASTRLIYDLWRPLRSVLEGGTHIDHIQPAWVGTIAREVHASVDAGPEVPIQFSVTYSDGVGREIQTKAQVEPGPLHLTDTQAPRIETRWLGSGWTIFNNKGKPVQQFEPFFAADHTYTHANTQGVSSILLYDSLERVMATLHPNHTYEKVVFDPWCQETWDTNDTILCGKPQEEMSSPDALDPANDEHVGKWFSEFPPTLYLPTWFHTRINEDLAKEKWPDTDEKGHPISHHAPRRQSEKRAAQ
ncbi:MAG: VCBS repeat-containing protein, partial [Nitrospira sp.]|nr:VCBS repeat-containing protein [Nitrospira sp.]